MCTNCYTKTLFGTLDCRVCLESCNCSCHIPPSPPNTKTTPNDKMADVIDLALFKSARRLGDSIKQAIAYARWQEPKPYEFLNPPKDKKEMA